MNALREAGFDAQTADATKFDPGPVDVLIMLNPAINPDVPASRVKPGGYALANDYHGTATKLLKNSTFELVGIIHNRTANGAAVLDTEDPQDYWMPAETDEAFRASTGYRGIGYMTQEFTGTTEPSLEQYRDAIIEAVEKPGAYEMDGYIWYERGTRMVPCGLPPKKGHMDDFFVFRKATPESDGSDVQAAHIGAAAVEHA